MVPATVHYRQCKACIRVRSGVKYCYTNSLILCVLSNSGYYGLHSQFSYLVDYEGGDPVLSSVGVDVDAVLPSQCFGPGPGYDGLLESLVQELGPRVQTERPDCGLRAFTVDVYLEGTGLAERMVELVQVRRVYSLVYCV